MGHAATPSVNKPAPQAPDKNRRGRAGLSTPVRGIARPVRAQTAVLGGSFEALFDPRAGDDRVAIAEAQPGPECAVLVPEVVELRVQSVDGFLGFRVELRREPMPKLGALLAQALDLCVDGSEGDGRHAP